MAALTLAGKKAVRTAQIIQCKKECAERKITVKQWFNEFGIIESSCQYYHKKISDSLVKPACITGTAVRCVSPGELSVSKFAQIPDRIYEAADHKAAVRNSLVKQ